MKQKRTNQRDWKRVPRQRLERKPIDNLTLVYLQALEVSKPLVVSCCGEQIKIMDKGYQWLYICNSAEAYCVTVQFNERNQPLQWYIDVLAKWHCDQEGFPYFDDLYLNIICNPQGKLDIKDADELNEALGSGVIDQDQYDFAWQIVQSIVVKIESKTFEPIKMTEAWLELFH